MSNKTQQGNEKKSISIAHIISIFGIGIVAVMLYIGLSTMEDITTSIAIILACVGLIALCVLLFILRHAKTVDNSFKAWKKAEWVICVGYVIIASASYFPISRTFLLYHHKEELKTVAEVDCNKIDSLITTYKAQEREKLTPLESLKTKVNTDKSLKAILPHASIFNYFKTLDPTISNNKSCRTLGLPSLVQNQLNRLDEVISDIRSTGSDGRMRSYNNLWSSQIAANRTAMAQFNVLEIGRVKMSIDKLTTEVPEELNKVAAELAENHYISLNKHKGKTILKQPVENSEYTLGELNFVSTMNAIMKGNSTRSIGLAIVFTILLHIVVLCCYIVAPRSRKLDIKQANINYGTPIKPL